MPDRCNGVFGPEAIEAMGRAFAMACARLAVRDQKSRDAIAFKIVVAARAGESDPERLCEKATGPELMVGRSESRRLPG
jgi:hypothetical protein